MSEELIQESGQCKYCTTPVRLEIHPDCPPLKLEVWRKMVCCEVCHVYATKLSRFRSAIVHLCMALYAAEAQWQNAKKQDDLATLRQKTREQLARLTQAVADVVCRRWNKPTVWEPDFIEQLLEKPTKAAWIVNLYERMVRTGRA